MSKQKRRQGIGPMRSDETLLEMKQLFITALAIVQEAGHAHTIIWEDPNTGEDSQASVLAYIRGIIEYGGKLEAVMGKEAFAAWLQRFLLASEDEKAAMWTNDGKWVSA